MNRGPARELYRGALGTACVVATLTVSACGDRVGREPVPSDLAELVPLPRPDLGGFSTAARAQLEGEIAALDASLAGDTPDDDLGERFGRIGRIYHAYGLLDAADVAYSNAESRAPGDFRWPYLAGVIDSSRGATVEAERHLRGSLDLETGHAAASLRLAELLLAENRWSEAEPLYERLFEVGVEPEMSLYGMARVADAAGDHALAVERYKQLLQLAPQATAVNYLLGLSYRKLGDTARAETYIARRGPVQVSFEDPLVDGLADLVTGVGTPIERGLEAFGQKDYVAAVAEYSRALEIEPGHATALRGRALSYRDAGDTERSNADFERLLELYPDDQLARLDYGTALLEAGEVGRAIDQLADAAERYPEFKEAHFNLGVALTRAERWREAAAAFDAVVELDPRNVAARYHLGMNLDEAGEDEEAIAALEAALREAPDHVPAQQRLALVRARLEGPESASATLRALIAAETTPAPEKALAYFQLGRLAKESGDLEAASGHYRSAVGLLPDLWQARFNLANALAESGQLEAAAVELAAAVSRDPANVTVRVREAEILRELGEYGIARARLEEGLEEVPRSAELAHALARVLVLAPQAAVRDGEKALAFAEGAYAAARTVEHGETVAMALAELGRFDEAIRWQERVLAQARETRDAGAVERLGRGLERLRRGLPLRDEAG